LKDTTRTAIAAILAADDTVPPQAAADALALLARGGAPATERRVVPFDEAARRLGGVTTRTLRNLRDCGRLRFVYGSGLRHRALGVAEDSLAAAIGG